jgi:lysozyme family protein
MVDFDALTRASLRRWQEAKLTRKSVSDSVARSLVAAKPRYQAVEAKTGVPWAVIAVIHERESSQNFKTQLGQGDPLNQVSVHKPAGRGPFKTWEDGAYDALVNCAPHLARRTDWSLAGVLIALELYNGLGYANKGVPSPYLWAGTNQYTAGKYVADGVYDPNKVDAQLGCVAMLFSMMAIDPTITFTGANITPIKVPPPQMPAPTPVPQPTPQPSFWAAFFSFVLSIFKRKP